MISDDMQSEAKMGAAPFDIIRPAGREASVPNGGVLIAVLTVVSIAVLTAAPSAAGERVRVPVDTIGYATTEAQMIEVVRLSQELIGKGDPGLHSSRVIARSDQDRPEIPGAPVIGGICPHDDYIYAGPAYVKLMSRVSAPLIILVGVSHRARRIGLQGKLVFDSYDSWKGPFGDVPVSSLRNRLISSLGGELVTVNDELHAGEHSIEGLIPFLQYPWQSPGSAEESPRCGIEIVPILVTRLAGESFNEAAEALAAALHAEFAANGMKLGRDVAVIISADCVHYGDEGWGDRCYAEFGVDREGYENGVAQDIDIALSTLAGKVSRSRIDRFRDRVDSYEFEYPYRIPWCGVYSIPFGLTLLEELCELEGRETPLGIMLDYSTSMEPGRLGLEETGLGPTSIATLRHWVGYASIGYW